MAKPIFSPNWTIEQVKRIIFNQPRCFCLEIATGIRFFSQKFEIWPEENMFGKLHGDWEGLHTPDAAPRWILGVMNLGLQVNPKIWVFKSPIELANFVIQNVDIFVWSVFTVYISNDSRISSTKDFDGRCIQQKWVERLILMRNPPKIGAVYLPTQITTIFFRGDFGTVFWNPSTCKSAKLWAVWSRK